MNLRFIIDIARYGLFRSIPRYKELILVVPGSEPPPCMLFFSSNQFVVKFLSIRGFMNFFFSDSNDQAATPRKKDLFAIEICVRGNSMKNRTEKKFFQAVYIYIYMKDSLLLFFFFFVFGGRVMRFWTREQTVRNAHCSLDRIPRFSNGSTVYRNVSICSTKSGPNRLTR